MNPELWARAPLLALASWLPVPLGALVVLLPAWPPFAKRAPAWTTPALFVITRIAFALVVLGALGHRSNDWLDYVTQGRDALAGRLPYRDFRSLYAPGFPYLLGLATAVSAAWGPWLLFLCADLGAYVALAALSGDQRPRADSALWAYVAFTPTWYFQARYAQDETVAALFLALALLALARGHPVRAGLALAAGQLFTKLLFALAAVPIVIAPRTPLATRLAWLLPVGAAYLALAIAGLPWAANLAGQAAAFGAGPTLWRVAALFWDLDPGRLAPLPFVIVTLAGWVHLWRRRSDAVDFAAWTWGSYALLAPKLLPMYAVMLTPALAVWVARGRGGARLAWWALYGFALGSDWYADSGPLQGGFGPVWKAVAALVVLLHVVLAAGLLASVWRRPGAGGPVPA